MIARCLRSMVDLKAAKPVLLSAYIAQCSIVTGQALGVSMQLNAVRRIGHCLLGMVRNVWRCAVGRCCPVDAVRRLASLDCPKCVPISAGLAAFPCLKDRFEGITMFVVAKILHRGLVAPSLTASPSNALDIEMWFGGGGCAECDRQGHKSVSHPKAPDSQNTGVCIIHRNDRLSMRDVPQECFQ